MTPSNSRAGMSRRRRGHGEGLGAPGGQDRQDRRPGPRRALPARPRARHLAARPDRPRRAGAGPLPAPPLCYRTALKNRIHATLIAFGHPVPVSDLFGAEGTRAAREPGGPRALGDDVCGACTSWTSSTRRSRLRGRAPGRGCRSPVVPLLMTIPGIAWVLGHHRRGARRHRQVQQSQEARRVHGALPDRPPVGRRDDRGPSPRTAPGTCAGRSSRRPPTPPGTRRIEAVRAHQEATRPSACR